ncbi:MAG: EamA family transporter [Solirubrobacterales bacterium]|nr:EamA family transporter [Solirubrobacterales bacterium]
MDRRSWTLLLVLAAIWGASYLLIKIAVRDLSPVMVAWARIALAAGILVPLAARQGALRVPRASVWWLALLGISQVAGPFVLIGAAEEEISSGLAGTLVASAPLFTALLAIRFDAGERSTGLRLGGIVLGLAGVAVLLGVDLGGSGRELIAGLAVLLAGLGYAIGGFIAKRHFASVAPLGLAAWVVVAGAILLLPAAIATVPSEAPSLGPVASVVALGVVGTGIAFAIFYELIGTVGPARTFIVTYLAPGFAVVYGAAFLDERITAAILAGLALILAGSWLAAGGGLGRRSRAGPPVAAPEPPVTPERVAAQLPD